MCNAICTVIYTKLFGKYIGNDEFQNKYYESRFATKSMQRDFGRKKRWALYSNKNLGRQDGSMLSNTWFDWLHHRTDIIPKTENANNNLNNGNKSKFKYFWMLLNIPNMTGTKAAYYPPHYKINANSGWVVKKEIGSVKTTTKTKTKININKSANGFSQEEDHTTDAIDGAYQAWRPANK